jgi:hypothetical protein
LLYVFTLEIFAFTSRFSRSFYTVSQTSPIEDYNSSKTYSTGALVLVGQNSYIATQSVPASTTPPNNTYWTNLSVAATSLQVPLETVPTLSTATILQSLPNSAPSDDNSSNISKLLGISTRGLVSSSMPMYGSVAITGSQSKKVAFMGKGQTMAAQGVTNYIADPVIEIWRVGSSGSWEVYKTNDNWGDASGTESISTVSGETGITVPVGTTESAIVLTLDPGNYSAILKSKSTTTQEGLVEAYEISESGVTSRLLGISTRGPMSSAYPMYGSIAISGTENKKVAFMGKGPTMSAQGVTNYIADPLMEIWRIGASGSWEVYKTNDNWGDASGAESISMVSGKTGITLPTSANEAAIVLTLSPGNYSAILKSKSTAVQDGLVEAYEITD